MIKTVVLTLIGPQYGANCLRGRPFMMSDDLGGTVVGVADLINFEFLFLLLQNGIWTILTCKKIFGA